MKKLSKGNAEWQELGKERIYLPRVPMRLTPEDVYGRKDVIFGFVRKVKPEKEELSND